MHATILAAAAERILICTRDSYAKRVLANTEVSYCLCNAMHNIGQSIKSPECPFVRPSVRPCVQLF